MKVIQTPVRFYPFMGGVENYVYYISRELSDLGCDMKVICANEPFNVSEETYNGIKIKRLPYITKVANTNITLSLPTTLLKEDYDIIHTHIPTPWSADWSNIINSIKNKPLILTYHNNIIAEKQAHIAQLYNKTALKLLLKKTKKIIITQNNYINSPHLQKYKEKIITIPNGVDTQKFKPQKEKTQKNTIFFLSVLDKYHKYKGLDYLLEAIKEIKKTIPDVKLIIGGKGELINYYKEKTEQLNITKNTEKILKKYRRHLYTEKHNKYNSINTHLIAITQFLKYCNIKAKPPLAKDPNKNKEPKYLTKKEITQLIKTIPEKNIRDKTIIQTLYHTGLRISELVALNKDDLNLKSKEQVIEINIKHGKGDKQRKVYINQETLQLINQMIKRDNQPKNKAIFLSNRKKRINIRTIQIMMKKYAQKTDERLQTEKNYYNKLTPHKLRHSFTIHLLNDAERPINEVMRLLGHNNISTTQLYSIIGDKKLKEGYAQIQW